MKKQLLLYLLFIILSTTILISQDNIDETYEENIEADETYEYTYEDDEEEDKDGLDLKGRYILDLYLNHYYKNPISDATHDFRYAALNTIRFDIKNKDSEYAKIETSIDINIYYGDFRDSYISSLTEENTTTNQTIDTIDNLLIIPTVRKLYIALRPQFADLLFGRQIINFGEGLIFSPINSFTTVDITDIEFTKTGSDIAMIRIPLGYSGGIDAITTLSTKMTNIISAIKVFNNIGGYELSLVGMYRHLGYETIIGGSVRKDFEAGVYGEVVGHFLDNGETRYIEAMLGVDYSFVDYNLSVNFEYYYNENTVNTDNINSLLELSDINKSFYNKHYLFFNVTHQINELQNISANIIYNPLDVSFILTGQYAHNIFQNVDLTLFTRYYEKNINGVKLLQDLSYKFQYGARVEVIF